MYIHILQNYPSLAGPFVFILLSIWRQQLAPHLTHKKRQYNTTQGIINPMIANNIQAQGRKGNYLITLEV
ncbi:hypothetical protein FKM82_003990 [Ascaphus truei]